MTTTALLDALKKHKPATLRVTLADGDERDVPIGRNRAKWAAAQRTLDAWVWTRLELRDPKGGVLATLVSDDATTPDEAPRAGNDVASLVALMLKAQDVAMQRHTEALKPTMEAMRSVVKDLTEQVIQWRAEAARQARIASQFAERAERALAAREAGDEDGALGELGDLVKLLPMMQLLAPGASAAPAPRPRPAAPAPAPAPKG